MRAYVFYTNPIIECVELLEQSTEKIQGLEVIRILGDITSTKDLAGETHSQEYMKLMLSRWLNLPDIIRNNIGTNILFIDADIVFNEYKKDFIKNIELFLEDNDLVTQYDTNSGMSAGINMGFLGIKCNEKNLSMFTEFMTIISKIENPKTGYPQIEFNDYLNDDSKKDPIKFKTLPQDYGYLTPNCYFYHAIGRGGNQSKIRAMKSALNTFEETSKLFVNPTIGNGKVALIVNTISKNKDVWEIFFDKIREHTPDDFFANKYVFVDDDCEEVPQDYKVIKYSTEVVYTEQFSHCIKSVEEEFCIYISEDYILYSDMATDKISSFKEVLNKDPRLSFVRFMRGGTYDGPFQMYSDNLFWIPTDKDYFYTNQAALWRTDHLMKIHDKGPKLHIANKDWQNSFEYQATKTCKALNINGLFCHYGEKKRGIYHYDSIIFPHISTALVKGRWNMLEYPKEMSALIRKYDLNIKTRGWV